MRHSRKPTLGNAGRRVVKSKSSAIVNAAALQDHFVRNLNLSLGAPIRKRRVQKAAPQSAATPPRNNNNESEDGYRKVWCCESCTLENEETATKCRACDTIRHRRRHHSRQKSLSLAQTRGLVPRPPPKLTSSEWAAVESKVENRDENGTTSDPCSICREPFKLSSQVILSCAHVFHQECLASFERFLRTSERTCPLCRSSNYQKKKTSCGANAYKRECVILIQRNVRRMLATAVVDKMRRAYYQGGFGCPDRRRAYFADRISTVSDRMICAMEAKNDSITSLLAEFDKSMRMSQRVFGTSSVTAIDDDDDDSSRRWKEAYEKCISRGDDDECPICINLMDNNKRQCSLLSCSHRFHTSCLSSFEEFNIYEVHLCPVCRSTYDSKVLTNDLIASF